MGDLDEEFTFVGFVQTANGKQTRLYVHDQYGECGSVVTEATRLQHLAWHSGLDDQILRRD